MGSDTFITDMCAMRLQNAAGSCARDNGFEGSGADLGYLHPVVQVLEGHGHGLERQHHALSL